MKQSLHRSHSQTKKLSVGPVLTNLNQFRNCCGEIIQPYTKFPHGYLLKWLKFACKNSRAMINVTTSLLLVQAHNKGFIQTPLRCLLPEDLTTIKPFFYSIPICMQWRPFLRHTWAAFCAGTLLDKCAKWINFPKFQLPWMARDDQWVVLLFDSFVLFHLQVSKATTGPNAWEGHSLHPHCLSPYLHATFLPSWMCIDRIMVSPPCIS